MTTRTKHARMTIDILVQEHKKLKAMAALMGISLKELVLNSVRNNFLRNNVPNEETLKAFKETEDGKGIVHCENFDDFVAKLSLK